MSEWSWEKVWEGEIRRAREVMGKSIRECATKGPLAMLNTIGKYLSEDAVTPEDQANYAAAKKRIEADHMDTTQTQPIATNQK